MLGREDKIKRRENNRHNGKHDDESDCEADANVTPQVFGRDIAAADAGMLPENQEPVPCNGDAETC